MKPLIILLVSFILGLFIIRVIEGSFNPSLAGCIALSLMLLATGIAHFIKPQEMALMLPPFIPWRVTLIMLTGVMEMAAAIGLLIPQQKALTGWCLILFFILVLPANIYAAVSKETGRRTAFAGQGLQYLWFRIPLQLFFIVWVYVFAIMKTSWL